MTMRDATIPITEEVATTPFHERQVAVQEVPAPEPKERPRMKITKSLRIYDDHNEMLAEMAFLRTRSDRMRVTESDIVAEALEAWAKEKGVDMAKYR